MAHRTLHLRPALLLTGHSVSDASPHAKARKRGTRHGIMNPASRNHPTPYDLCALLSLTRARTHLLLVQHAHIHLALGFDLTPGITPCSPLALLGSGTLAVGALARTGASRRAFPCVSIVHSALGV
ncbi:hypothetical protein DFH06DRAFT_1233535 [Mycena polygramma]|nr:hypothetical protein DFH06DRAFT_1233535 [Mycena polygramma]